MRTLSPLFATLFALAVLTGCDTATPSPEIARGGPASAVPSEGPGGLLNTVSIPTTAGMSEYDFVNVTLNANGTAELLFSDEHPMSGMVLPQWHNKIAHGSQPSRTYQQLAGSNGSTDPERLHWVAQQMLLSSIEAPIGSPPVSFGPEVTDVYLELPSTITHWNGALITKGDPNTSDVTVHTTVDFKSSEDDIVFGQDTFSLRGGREPGVFMRFGGSTYNHNGYDSDRPNPPLGEPGCQYPGGSKSEDHTFGLPQGVAQGAEIFFGGYAQRGEFYLWDGVTCQGGVIGGGSVTDTEFSRFNLFSRTNNNHPELLLSGANSPVSYPWGYTIKRINFTNLAAGESVQEIWIRNEATEGYVPAIYPTSGKDPYPGSSSSTHQDVFVHANGGVSENYVIVVSSGSSYGTRIGKVQVTYYGIP